MGWLVYSVILFGVYSFFSACSDSGVGATQECINTHQCVGSDGCSIYVPTLRFNSLWDTFSSLQLVFELQHDFDLLLSKV